LLNKEIKNNTFKAFFINAFLSNDIVLDYYLDKHTNNLVNIKIKEQELDLSKLNELSSSINTKKNCGLMSILKKDPYNIILMNGLILKLFDYESNIIINPQKIDLFKKKSDNYLVIRDIYANKLFEKVNNFNSKNNNDQKDVNLKINSCFSNIFFKQIIDLSSKTLELNKIYFLFCLDNEIINKYYSSFNEFLDFDYITLEFYSLVRNKNCILEIKHKFLKFLESFNFIESILIFTIRILSNEKTFQKLISKCDNHSEKTASLLNDIIVSLLNNLLKYNSYQSYTENLILNIINNIFAYASEILHISKNDKKLSEEMKKELNYLVDIINYIFKTFSTDNNINIEKQDKNINKSNEKVNENLIKKINKVLEKRTNDKNITNNDKELLNFIKSQGNITDNKNKIDKLLMDNDLMISSYIDNPKQYPFPIEQYISKLGGNI
jgi:hypothetical protein